MWVGRLVGDPIPCLPPSLEYYDMYIRIRTATINTTYHKVSIYSSGSFRFGSFQSRAVPYQVVVYFPSAIFPGLFFFVSPVFFV